ncbi:MAG: DUF4382 domain-containing protein, partial [Bacteroidota bacterium]
MKISSTVSIFASFAILIVGIISCQDKQTSPESFLSIALTDAPGDFDSVLVNIVGVEVHTDAGGWQSLAVDSGKYDLLSLQNGIDTVLATPHSVPSGLISQVRLILGDSSTVVVNGVSYPLALSSQDETGLKCNLHDTLQPNTTYEILLDFDADRSIVQQGNGVYR